MKLITGNANVRSAARDYERYSSDLQGDQDVRDYKQLPLEVDPPLHTSIRSLIAPVFTKDSLATHETEFRTLITALVEKARAAGEVEVISQLALPMIVQCLGVVFGRPQDVDEWYSWGPDTWITDEDGIRHGDHLDRYLKKTFDELDAHPTDDLFGQVNRAELDGRPLTRLEKYGIANLVLAGGRDTVVKLVCGSLSYLAHNDKLRTSLVANTEALPGFISEMVRFLSPLPMMHRVDKQETTDPENPKFVWLSFISANHDETAIECPSEIRLDRGANPHLGFGYGRHSCIGLHLAQLQTRILLEIWLSEFGAWSVGEDSIVHHNLEGFAHVPSSYEKLTLKLHS
jgi:cytochrome P450